MGVEMRRPLMLVSPGLGNSGPTHWQSLWEADPAVQPAARVARRDWDRPDRDEWRCELDAAVRGAAAASSAIVLVGHSLACLNFADWAGRAAAESPELLRVVRGALLVAPPNPDRPDAPERRSLIGSFAPVPSARLPTPTVVVASRTDPYADFAFAERLARSWGSRLVDAGDAGHVNAASGLGAWEAGRRLLLELMRDAVEARPSL